MKRKATRSNPRSTAIQGILYEEATGKTVDFIRYAEHSSGWPAFEVRFTDGTFLFIEPMPRVQFRVRLLKTNRGTVKIIREYGVNFIDWQLMIVFVLENMVIKLAITSYNLLTEVIYWPFISGQCRRSRQELPGGSRPGVLPRT